MTVRPRPLDLIWEQINSGSEIVPLGLSGVGCHHLNRFRIWSPQSWSSVCKILHLQALKISPAAVMRGVG